MALILSSAATASALTRQNPPGSPVELHTPRGTKLVPITASQTALTTFDYSVIVRAARSLSEKNITELSNAFGITEGEYQEAEFLGMGKRTLIQLIFTIMALVTVAGLTMQLFSDGEDSDVASEPLSEAEPERMAATSALVASAGQHVLTNTTQQFLSGIGRRVLASAALPTIVQYMQNLTCTEEVPCSNTWYNDALVYPSSSVGGPLSFSAQQMNGLSLPAQISVINTPMKITASYPIANCISVVDVNGYAVTVSENGIIVLDTSVSSEPTAVYSNLLTIAAVANSGPLLYVINILGNSPPELKLLDFSNPINPITRGTFSGFPSNANLGTSLIASDGSYCYIIGTTGSNPSTKVFLQTINVQDPGNMTSVNITDITASSFPFMNCLTVDSGYLYLGYADPSEVSTGGGFQVFDVRNHTNSSIVGSLRAPGISVTSIEVKNNVGYITTLRQGLQIFSASNPAKTPIIGAFGNSTSTSGTPQTLAAKVVGNICYLLSSSPFLGSIIQKLDVSVPSMPFLLSSATTPTPVPANFVGSIAVTDTNCFFTDSVGTKTCTLGSSVTISGTPNPGTQGVYPTVVSAQDSAGNVATQSVTLTINPAITLTGTVPPIRLICNSPSTASFGRYFSHVNGAQLKFKANLVGSTSLPDGLSVNLLNGDITGTLTTPGNYQIQLIAYDNFGASTSTTTQLVAQYGPGLSAPITVLPATTGNFYNQTIDQLVDKDGLPITLTVTSNGATLPAWLNFVCTTDSPPKCFLFGTPALADTGVVPLTFQLEDSVGNIFSTSLQLNVGPEVPPVVVNPPSCPSATVGAEYFYALPPNIFSSPYTDSVSVQVTPEAGWITATPQSLTGTPGYTDTDAFSDKVTQLQVCGTGIGATTCTTCSISVGGESVMTLTLKILGALGTAGGIYKYRHSLWQLLGKKYYQKPSQDIYVGQQFSRTLVMPQSEIANVEALHDGKNFLGGARLPDWIKWDNKNKTLSSQCVQNEELDFDTITIRATDHRGFIREQFDLKIQPAEQASLVANAAIALDVAADDVLSPNPAVARLNESTDSAASDDTDGVEMASAQE